MTFNSTISLSDLVMVATVSVACWRVWVGDHDVKKSMATMLADHEDRVAALEAQQSTHHEWLIRNGLDAPTPLHGTHGRHL